MLWTSIINVQGSIPAGVTYNKGQYNDNKLLEDRSGFNPRNVVYIKYRHVSYNGQCPELFFYNESNIITKF